MKKANNTIEDSFKEIDKIINQMDDEKCSIEKSLKLYDEGTKILNDVSKKIDKIEKEIKVIERK